MTSSNIALLHTPGPWSFSSDSGCVNAKDGNPVAFMAHPPVPSGSMDLVKIHGMALANGGLVASSPDLFAVLNELHDSFDQQTYSELARRDHDPHDDDEFSVNITAKQLRAINNAILKAEGKL